MNFDFGNVYNFLSISQGVLSTEYRNMKVVGIVGFQQAIKYSGPYKDIMTIREQLINETGINLIPANKAKYIIFNDENQDTIILAEDWIKLDTIVLVTAIDLSIIINNITNDDVNVIVNTLRSMGYKKLEIDTRQSDIE